MPSHPQIQNQTHQKAIKTGTTKNLAGEDELGTGIFVIGNPESLEEKNYSTIILPEMSYHDCLKRGKNCLAFKWMPKDAKTYEEILAVKRQVGCTGLCPGPDCDGSYGGACVCMGGDCWI
jgi:hypothetical protein